MPRKAASTAASGVPANVTTVRLVLAPGSTFNSEIPSTASIAAVICRITSGSRPSEKLGTHSMTFCMAFVAPCSVSRLRLGRNPDVVRPCKFDRARISGVSVTQNAHAGVAGEYPFKAAFRALGSVGYDDHSGVLRITNADAPAVVN